MSAPLLASVQRDPCSYCGGPADELDHIDAQAHGGGHDWTNLTAACSRCNQSKGARALLSFLLHRNRPLTAGQRIKRTFGENACDASP
jgi:5-methylcytosine-specific restriction endonuclease McrA